MAKYNKKYEGVCAYLRPEMLDSVLQTNGETCTSFYVVRFAQRTKLKQAIADVKEKYGLADGAVEENLAAVAWQGGAAVSRSMRFIRLRQSCLFWF